MSYHSTIEGRITYSAKTDRDAVLTELSDKGWETENRGAETVYTVDSIIGIDTDTDEYVILIPRNDYQNFGKHIELLTTDAVDWKIIESSGDGALEGYVHKPDGTEIHDLHDWVANNDTDLSNQEPKKEAFDTVSEWFDAHVEWQLDVEYSFLSLMKEELELDFNPFLGE